MVRTLETPPSVLQAKSPQVSWAVIRRTFAVTSLGAASAALVLAVGFATWVNADNAITYPAIEMSRAPVYPPGHQAFGLALGLALALTAALTFGLAAATRISPATTGRQMVAAMVVALCAGVTVPVSIEFSVAIAAPFIAVGVVALLLLRSPRKKVLAPAE